MASIGLELSGFALGILGLLGTLLATVLPHWRTTAFIGSNIITTVGYLKGLWMECAYFSTGTFQCEMYRSLLALPPDLQAARAMMVISVVLSTLGCVISSIGMKCTVFMLRSTSKSQVAGAGGCCFLAAGFMCLVPVSWTTNEVIRLFYNPMLPNSYRYEMGVALYLGMVSGMLSLLAGGILCASCCGQEEGSRRPGLRLSPYPNRNPQRLQPMTFRNPAVQNSYAIGSIKHNISHDGYNLDGYV
ncbi:claudin-14-like [Polyodon spathula]|uniref:claudin-14-like n=1 Tax=Polyodon spathula TaxID=7913 RepID=UPI001B7E0D95|nr:claudin-14-like [Polyodon spathula]